MKTLLILLSIAAGLNLYCQESDQKHFFQLGMSFSYNPNIGAYRFLGDESDDNINGRKFYSGELFGSYSLSKHLRIENGIGFTQFKIQIDPWGNNNEYYEKIPYIYLPVRLRFDFLKYFFCRSGIIFGFDFSEPGELDNQTGIGFTLGTGFKYEFKNRLSVFVNPYATLYKYISYDHGPFRADVIIESSLQAGLLYRFK